MRNAPGEPSGPAKFGAPVASHVVARPRLYELLDNGAQYPVTLVAATAGWGKTLLAASWIAAGAGGRASAWVRLDPDDDAAGFWHTVAGALASVAGPEAGAALRPLTAGGDDVDDMPGAVAAALHLAARPVVLVLDNLHEVTSPVVHDGLVMLVERPPPNLSLLVLTRRDPPWPLSRLRLAGLIGEVRAQDLAFRVGEAAELFALLHVDLDASQVGRLVERTEGWPAGLRLVALHLQGQPDVEAAVAEFSGDDHSVAGYLVTEVLAQQPPELVRFLEKISTVDLVCADLADALTGRRDSEALLTELAASHLFVQAVDRPGRWYHLHRLIADILQARPVPRSERRDLRRRAAEWFQRSDMPVDAIRSAVDGELWPLAAALVGHYLVVLVLGGRARELERVLARVPRATLAAHPELACGLAAARIVRGDATEVADLVASGRARLRSVSARRGARARILLDLTAGALARARGDWDEVVALHRSVPLDPVTLAGLGLGRAEIVPVLVKNVLGMAALLSADLEAAERDLGAAVSVGIEPRPLSQLNAAAYLSLVRCERGELGPAQCEALEVVKTAAEAGLDRAPQVVGAYLTMAHVALDRVHPEDFDNWLARTAAVESVAAEPHVRVEAALLLAARRESAGDRERALSGLRVTASEIDIARLPRRMRERWSLAEAGLLVGLGDPNQARATLDRLGPASSTATVLASARLRMQLDDVPAAVAARAAVEPEQHPRGTVDASLLDTALAIASEDVETALDRLEEALAAAAPWFLRRPFLTEAVDLRPILERRLENGTVVPAFAVDVLGRLSGAAAHVPDPSAVDPLTERERTVLRYLASTMSNAEIAAVLYVSVNTVKTHERALYRKLDVTNRREAVARARALGLL
jgi:LuxR family transcriptional regulator, maltose regulon positive regulatory protein